MKIGEFAKQLGTNAKTVRYYEELGLLAPPARTESGYREYGPADLERLRFVLGAKALGLTLAEIQEVVAVWTGGTRPCGHVSRLLQHKLEDLDARIAELTAFRTKLAAYLVEVEADTGVACAHVEGVGLGRWDAKESVKVPGTGIKKT